MSISTALNTAMSGLGAAGRTAQVVSSNISNALTDGYGRREITLASGRFGGVEVTAVQRQVDRALIHERRQADAEGAGLGVRSEALARIAGLYGKAGAGDSIPGRVARLEARLTEAASRPEAATRLTAVADAAGDLARTIAAAATGVQATRLDAERGIASDVDALRTGLDRVDVLNRQIQTATVGGRDVNALLDQRQRVIDALGGIVPMRELPRPNGAVALMTANGQILLDGSTAEIGFTRVDTITPAMALGGALSGLTVNGRPADMADPAGRMSGGSLGAHFAVRDALGPDAQVHLDILARDLIERFETPGLDPTAGIADPGLFTDDGARLDPTSTLGLANRLTLNAVVDPAAGGEPRRLRDGLGAATPGQAGDARFLQALSAVIGEPRAPTAGTLGSGELSFGRLADALTSEAGGALFRSEEEAAFTAARSQSLRQQELAGGVDTDQEMQTLLLVEQAYSANARVIEAADGMLKRLLEI